MGFFSIVASFQSKLIYLHTEICLFYIDSKYCIVEQLDRNSLNERTWMRQYVVNIFEYIMIPCCFCILRLFLEEMMYIYTEIYKFYFEC